MHILMNNCYANYGSTNARSWRRCSRRAGGRARMERRPSPAVLLSSSYDRGCAQPGSYPRWCKRPGEGGPSRLPRSAPSLAPVGDVVIVGRRRGDAVRVEARFITRSPSYVDCGGRTRLAEPATDRLGFVPAGKIAIGSGDLTLRLPEGPGDGLSAAVRSVRSADRSFGQEEAMRNLLPIGSPFRKSAGSRSRRCATTMSSVCFAGSGR